MMQERIMSRLDPRIFSDEFDPVRTILSELPTTSERKKKADGGLSSGGGGAAAADRVDEYDEDNGDSGLDEEIEFIERKMADIDQVI
jgi:hypothetical protein